MVFEEVSNSIYNNYNNVFLNSLKFNFNDLNDSWNASVDKTYKTLKKEDIILIKSFGKLLGKTDLDGQINDIEFTNSMIELKLKEAIEEKNKNSKLYKSLGLILGISICIILY